MDCLKDFIGISVCEGTKPKMEVSSLPFITLKSLDSIASEDRLNFVGVIEAIRNRAGNRILGDLYASIGLQMRTPTNVYCVGRLKSPTAPVTPVTDSGVIFKTRQSNYLTINIDAIEVLSPIVQTITIFVKDLVSNETLYSETFDLEIGTNMLPINFQVIPRARNNEVLVGYQGATLYDTSTQDCYEGCSCSCLDCDDCESLIGYPNAGSTYGLSVKYHYECSLERFLCENMNIFSQALLYAFGIEYIYELKGSDRVNKYTMWRREEATEMLEYYEKNYAKHISRTIKGIDFCSDCCFKCTGGLQSTWRF